MNGELLTYFSLQPVWFNEMPMPKPGLFGLPHAPSEHNWNLLHEAKWPTPPGREYLGSAYYEADSSSDDGGSAAAADTAQSLDDDDESSPWDYTGSAHTT